MLCGCIQYTHRVWHSSKYAEQTHSGVIGIQWHNVPEWYNRVNSILMQNQALSRENCLCCCNTYKVQIGCLCRSSVQVRAQDKTEFWGGTKNHKIKDYYDLEHENKANKCGMYYFYGLLSAEQVGAERLGPAYTFLQSGQSLLPKHSMYNKKKHEESTCPKSRL